VAGPSEFELLGRVTIGQYLPTGSRLHHLDPRIKLLMVVLMITAVIVSHSLVGLALLLAVVVAGLQSARIPLRFALAGLRPMLPFLLLLALLQVVAIPQYGAGATIIWRWSLLTVTDRSLLAGILLIARFTVMVLGISLFSFSTTTTELTHGVEHLLRPLQALGVPAHEFALVVNIAIRFLPILAEEAERLMKAQASRGADFGRGQRNFITRTRRLLPLLVPLFLVSLRRAEQLIEAMEARSYLGGKGRTHLIYLQARTSDYVALASVAGVAALVIRLSLTNADGMAWRWLTQHLL
jgi:energy-coupling factor transport system permease protein